MTSKVLRAELPLGLSGLNGSRNMSQIRPDELIEADNITFENGTLQKEGGAAKYNSTAITGTPAVVGGWDWHPTAGTQRMVVVTSNGKILKDTGAGDFTATLATGLTATGNVPIFVEGGQEDAAGSKKLFMFSGDNPVQVLTGDGASTARLATGTDPADWASSNPTFGLGHKARLWGGGNASDPHRLYYSSPTDHEDFQDGKAGTVAIYPGQGEALVAGLSWRGFILVWKKPRGLYLVDTRSNVTAEWRVDVVNESLGAPGPGAIVAVDDDVLYMDNGGNLHLVSQTSEETIAGRPTSDAMSIGQLIRNEMNLARLWNVRMVYYVAKREVHVALPLTGETSNTRRLVLDMLGGGPRFRLCSRDTPMSLWMRRDSDDVLRLTMGDASGTVWNLDQDSKAQDGDGYAAVWQTAHMDLSHIDLNLATIRKNGKFLEIVMEPQGAWSMDVEYYWDGDLGGAVTFDMGGENASLGSFVLGTDALGGGEVTNRKRRITGSGRRISLRGTNDGAAQDFSIARAFIHFTEGGERL